MKATQTNAINLAIRSGSVRWVSSKLNPPVLKALNILCKALHKFFYAKLKIMQSNKITLSNNQLINPDIVPNLVEK